MRRLRRSADSRREAYRGLLKAHVGDGMLDKIRAATNGNYVLINRRQATIPLPFSPRHTSRNYQHAPSCSAFGTWHTERGEVFYNRIRRHAKIGNQIPADFAKQFYADSQMAA